MTWLVIQVCSTTLPQAAAQSQTAYPLSAGDAISISVFEEPDLHLETEIGSSGEISFPLVGTVQVTGLTTEEVREIVTQRLADRFIKDPQVTVSMMKYRDFYINGAVESPGGYPYQPGLTVRKAISIAGGMTSRASSRKVYLIEEGDETRALVRVNVDHPVNPGDIIQIEEGLF